MKIIFHTNIDAYSNCNFPSLSTKEASPDVGHRVEVNPVYRDRLLSLRLPTSLEIKAVTWRADAVVCELHYSEGDVHKANILNINLFP